MSTPYEVIVTEVGSPVSPAEVVMGGATKGQTRDREVVSFGVYDRAEAKRIKKAVEDRRIKIEVFEVTEERKLL